MQEGATQELLYFLSMELQILNLVLMQNYIVAFTLILIVALLINAMMAPMILLSKVELLITQLL